MWSLTVRRRWRRPLRSLRGRWLLMTGILMSSRVSMLKRSNIRKGI